MFDLTLNPELAKKIGFEEAYVVSYVRAHISYHKRRAHLSHRHEGQYWIYNSLPNWCAEFDWWTEKQIRRILASLVSQGILKVGRFTYGPKYKTNWYTFVQEHPWLTGIAEGVITFDESDDTSAQKGGSQVEITSAQKGGSLHDNDQGNSQVAQKGGSVSEKGPPDLVNTSALEGGSTTINNIKERNLNTGIGIRPSGMEGRTVEPEFMNCEIVQEQSKTNINEKEGSVTPIVTPKSRPKKAVAERKDDEGKKVRVQVWKAYSEAYSKRYGISPISNAMVFGQIANLVKRIGEDAIDVAAFYVNHNTNFYVLKCHPVGLLLADAEALRTQWATNKRVTAQTAQGVERTSTNLDLIKAAMERLEGNQ